MQDVLNVVLVSRAESDILLGRNCGVRSLMVGTGVDTLESAKELDLAPEFWADSLGQLWQRIKADLI